MLWRYLSDCCAADRIFQPNKLVNLVGAFLQMVIARYVGYDTILQNELLRTLGSGYLLNMNSNELYTLQLTEVRKHYEDSSPPLPSPPLPILISALVC